MAILSPSKTTLNIIVGIITALALIIGICAELQKTNSGSDFEEHAYKETMRICGWGTFALGGLIIIIELLYMKFGAKIIEHFNEKKARKKEDTEFLTP